MFQKTKKRNYKKELNEALSKLSDALWDNITLRTDIEELKEENDKLKAEKLFGNYPSTEDDLPFGAPDEDEKPEEDITYLTDRIEYLEEDLEKLEDARQSDLITINQLQVALDVVLDKYERLRKQKGLVWLWAILEKIFLTNVRNVGKYLSVNCSNKGMVLSVKEKTCL